MRILKKSLLMICFSLPIFSAHAAFDFTKQDLELVKSACLAGSSFEFTTEADGSISVKNLEGRGKLHISKKSVDIVDVPDEDKRSEFSDIRQCIKDYLLLSKEENKKYNVVIRSGSGGMYDNRRFGEVDGSISRVILKVDDRQITKHNLDEIFGSHKVQLVKGDHTFEFVAEIYGNGNDNTLILEDNCQGTFTVTESGVFEPRLKFEALTPFDGKITDCSLEPTS